MVEANRRLLLALLAGLYLTLGNDGGKLRRSAWRYLLSMLVPMEAAARRLVSIVARDMVAALPVRRGTPKTVRKARPEKPDAERTPPFALADRLRDPLARFRRRCPARLAPRISFLGESVPGRHPPEPSDGDLIEAAALRSRLDALRGALDDLPGQARRLARWTARQRQRREKGLHSRTSPIRSGRPPGHRARGRRAVDRILADCHGLALDCRAMLARERYGR